MCADLYGRTNLLSRIECNWDIFTAVFENVSKVVTNQTGGWLREFFKLCHRCNGLRKHILNIESTQKGLVVVSKDQLYVVGKLRKDINDHLTDLHMQQNQKNVLIDQINSKIYAQRTAYST